MSYPDDVLIIGWEETGKAFGKFGRAMRYKQKALEAREVIFKVSQGKPPSKRVSAFPSIIRRYCMVASRKRVEV